MSSIAIDGSGTRGLSLTMNDQARTAASMPTKNDDELALTINGNGGELLVIVPGGVELERVEISGGEFYRLRIPGGFSNARYVRRDGHEGIMWPHAQISARRTVDDYYADAPTEPLGTLADLAGPKPDAPAE